MRVLLVLCVCLASAQGDGPYNFYRRMDSREEQFSARRVFGGNKASLSEFPTACVITKMSGKIKCTGAIVAEKFVLTAAHCVSPDAKKVRYNTKHPNSDNGDTANIVALYRHPWFKTVEKDEGRGMDVTELYHDVGMVETLEPMLLSIPLKADPLAVMGMPIDLENKEVKVMGFGRRDISERSLGEELFSVHLLVRACQRPTWVSCVCGVPEPGARSRGVCSGDSGGPVLYNGTQVGVTSMGPIECVTQFNPSAGSTSVFTYVADYVDIINKTVSRDSLGPKMAPLSMSNEQIKCETKLFLNLFVFCCVLLLNWV